MSKLVLNGDVSGSVTLDAPSAAGTTTLTLPTTSGTLAITAAPTFTGQATIPTINLTGGQITFPATQVPSADANTLDDYEEGTWTPTPDTGFPTGFTGVTATYTKVGRIVFFTVTMTATTDGTTIQVGGLPFNAASSGGVVFGYWGSSILRARVTTGAIQMITSATFSSTSVQLGGVYSI
jgi:hypothetical protein